MGKGASRCVLLCTQAQQHMPSCVPGLLIVETPTL